MFLLNFPSVILWFNLSPSLYIVKLFSTMLKFPFFQGTCLSCYAKKVNFGALSRTAHTPTWLIWFNSLSRVKKWNFLVPVIFHGRGQKKSEIRKANFIYFVLPIFINSADVDTLKNIDSLTYANKTISYLMVERIHFWSELWIKTFWY